ncbi:MAG: uracil-DNA glycosylase [Candidatus Omnitrophica bacterium]|nr:uracil-DNA glycosylase [Candidatus Omnitrophota bacterium]
MNGYYKDLEKDLKSYMDFEKESGMADDVLSGLIKPMPFANCSDSPGGGIFTAHNVYTAQDKARAMDTLKAAVLECSRCRLCKSRRNIVFGEGSYDARLMFIGEAPGLNEDIQARPFVGKAGELLSRIIEAIGLRREDVYITNCLKCRPPQNRNPLPDEIASCNEFFMRQIDIIKPVIVCCLGKFAAQTILSSQEPISKLRGRFYEVKGVNVLCTFHPAYLLRNPQDKRLAWEDMKNVRDMLKA